MQVFKKIMFFQTFMNLILFPIHRVHSRIPDLKILNESIHLGHAFNDLTFQRGLIEAILHVSLQNLDPHFYHHLDKKINAQFV